MTRSYSDALLRKIDETASRYPTKQAALLPVLHLIQNETGLISADEELLAAERLGLKPIKVREVVTFYTMFNQKPVGRYHIQVCSNVACGLAGADGLRDYLQAKLGIRVGETTPDGKYTLTEVECLGACDRAPCMMINTDSYGNLDREEIDGILEKTRMNEGLKILTGDFGLENLFRIDVYAERGGYQAARTAILEWKPEAVLDEVKKASLRGRGGAGFPAGLKWSFVPQKTDGPKYLCVNADEGEPGTFKDRYILGHNPHLLIEGTIIASYAVGIRSAFVYIRGEYESIARRLEGAVAEAYERGFLGKSVFGGPHDLDLIVHRGAGAYVCGEETSLLESLEGKRGYPRLKPPFPATVGLFKSPTVINNVETLCNVPFIIRNGAHWFTEKGLPKDGGTRAFSVSGAVAKPGVYELPVGTRLKEIIFDHAGGLKSGRKIKAVIPGGSSSPILRADEIDIRMDGDSVAAAGSMLGSGAVIVIDDATPIIDVLKRIAKFYAHESCGQCTPCRIGTSWIHKIVKRLAEGRGEPGDVENLGRLAANIKGRTLCPLGDAAAMPVMAIVSKFKGELEPLVRVGKG